MIEAPGNLPGRPDYFRIPINVGPDGTRQFGTLEPVFKAGRAELKTPMELETLHEHMQDTTGVTAIAVFEEMQTYEGFPFGTPKEVIAPQKDRNDNIATQLMIKKLNSLPYWVDVVVAEGGKDIADGAEIELMGGVHGKGGVKLGDGDNVEWDLAIDPLEGTTKSVTQQEGEDPSVKQDGVVVAEAAVEPGGFADIPEGIHRMQKFFAPNVPGLSIDDPADISASKVVSGLNTDFNHLRVSVLNRPRNQQIIDDLTSLVEHGLDLDLIDSGDLIPAVMVGDEPGPDGKYTMVMGIGGAPEGLIAAAALKAKGNAFVEARWSPEDPEEKRKYSKVLPINDLVPARADRIAVNLAHITADSKYTGQQGITQLQNGHIVHNVAFTSVDINGTRHHTKTF